MTPEKFNSWRIMPRILMLSYYTFFMFAFWRITVWVMDYNFNSLTSETIALAVVAFPTGILGVLAGVLTMLTKSYFETGGNGN